MITVVIKVFHDYTIVTFFLLFAGGDWAALGPLRLSRIDLVCSYNAFRSLAWSQGRSVATDTLRGGHAMTMRHLNQMDEDITRDITREREISNKSGSSG